MSNHREVEASREEMLSAYAESRDAESADRLVQRAGGRDVWQAMMQHANQHWSDEFRDGFADAITGNDPRRADRAVDYLRKDFAESLGRRMKKQGF